jgi:integrase
MVIVALCTGVRCSELVALKWSDFDWQNLSVYIRRAIVSGRVDDVKTEYSEAPLPLDPALAEVIFEWRRKTEFSADSDFVFASPYMAGEKPYTPWNMQHNHLSPAAIKAGLGPIGWRTLRHTYRAWLGDNGEPLTVQKELMRHATDPMLERHPIEIFHHDEGLLSVLADFVDRANVRVVQRRGGTGFATKTFERLRVLG